MSSIELAQHLQIPLQELSDATNAFSEENLIARGGFGNVYKGVSVKHGTIAIKMLDPRLGQGDNEFKQEIALLSVNKHENIVTLLGFCDEDGKKILVYKHEMNGSLNNHLNSKDLTWIQRLKICLDAARGLKYLHDDVGSETRILHRDVKSPNILLNENWKAKIADFGLSKIGPANVEFTFLISKVCGTFGYIDPEYYATGFLTKESDVYSFGIVLFEVLCGRPACVIAYKHEHQFLANLIMKHWRKKTLDKIVYSGLKKQINRASLLTFSSIAYQCLLSGKERPTMKKVVEQLQKAIDNQLAASGQWTDDDDFGAHHRGKSAELLASSSETTPSASSSNSGRCDVFISSSGESTHKTFADYLYNDLVRRQVITYKPYRDYSCRHQASHKRVVIEARIAIVIITKGYVNDSQCLGELAFAMRNRDAGKQIVIPIFCGVERSEVRSQTTYNGEALVKHELIKSHTKIESWRDALSRAADLSGWVVDVGNESKHIRKEVGRISNEILRLLQHSKASAETRADTDLIGIEARRQELKLLLDVGTGGVHKVGISGMWGSGKSILASSIYDEISHEFESCCLVENVRDRSRIHGLKMLQEEILSSVLKLKVTLTNLEQGIAMMEKRLCLNSVLIVLDDVDHTDHLKMLVGSDHWFGNGSRIIFTSRNQDLVEARSSLTHNVTMLDVKEAIELFSRRAFGKNEPAQGFEEISLNIVSKFGGHPSALIRLGSFLHDKDMSEWMSILDRLKDRPVDEILEEFKTPDDGLARKFFPRFFT